MIREFQTMYSNNVQDIVNVVKKLKIYTNDGLSGIFIGTSPNNVQSVADILKNSREDISKEIEKDVKYDYTSNNWNGIATDGAVNRMAQVSSDVQITSPKPTTEKVGDFILRFSVNASSAPTVKVNPPSGCSFTTPLYIIGGDEIGISGDYEMMIQLIPTATPNKYDYIECVRKIS